MTRVAGAVCQVAVCPEGMVVVSVVFSEVLDSICREAGQLTSSVEAQACAVYVVSITVEVVTIPSLFTRLVAVVTVFLLAQPSAKTVENIGISVLGTGPNVFPRKATDAPAAAPMASR